MLAALSMLRARQKRTSQESHRNTQRTRQFPDIDECEIWRHPLVGIKLRIHLIGHKMARQSVGEDELPQYRHDGFARPDPPRIKHVAESRSEQFLV
ncbi:hypothetical protein ASG35_12900 [Burkholderia sp. Leaf177]|nr:hypothetical protein ASG35_12900 [Burkholderia sp. Leaf177]